MKGGEPTAVRRRVMGDGNVTRRLTAVGSPGRNLFPTFRTDS